MRKAKLTKQLQVLTTEEEHQMLKDLSDKYEVSMGEVVRNLIRKQMNEVRDIKTDARQMSLV